MTIIDNQCWLQWRNNAGNRVAIMWHGMIKKRLINNNKLCNKWLWEIYGGVKIKISLICIPAEKHQWKAWKHVMCAVQLSCIWLRLKKMREMAKWSWNEKSMKMKSSNLAIMALMKKWQLWQWLSIMAIMKAVINIMAKYSAWNMWNENNNV